MKTREVWMVCASMNAANCCKTLPLWRARGYKTLVLQHTRLGDCGADVAVWCEQDLGSPAAWNFILDRLLPPSADLVVLGTDTLVPDQSFVASEMAESFFERFPDGLGVMQPLHASGDDQQRTGACPSPFLGRGWIERAYGGYGALHTRYAHYCADFELYWVAKSLGVLWERLDIHHTLHPEVPSPSENFTRYRNSDFALLQQRVAMGFPGSMPAGTLGVMNSEVLAAAKTALEELVSARPNTGRRAA